MTTTTTTKVFISYSWDDDLHKDWVVNLMNELRKNGIDAKIDRSITQSGTVNLNRMMIEGFRDSDFIITVLTENYAQRADEYSGGVGLETMLLGNELLNNIKKIIPIKRGSENYEKVIPYCLKGVNYTDFSVDTNFDKSFMELLHRIYEVDMIEIAPLGKRPDLKPRNINYNPKVPSDFSNDIFIPNLKSVTDVDKKKFVNDSFKTIKELLIDLCNRTSELNNIFDFEVEEVSKIEYSISFYINGMEKTFIRLWSGAMLGSRENNILISYNRESFSKTSFNEMLRCETKNNNLVLKMTMNMNNKPETVEGIVKEIWSHICLYLK